MNELSRRGLRSPASRCLPRGFVLCCVIGMSNHLMAGDIADSFSNNHPDVDLWAVRHTDIDAVRVVERNQRVEFEISSQLGAEEVAGYIGNGWAIDPRQPVQFQVSMHFALPSVVQGEVNLVVGFSEDHDGLATEFVNRPLQDTAARCRTDASAQGFD